MLMLVEIKKKIMRKSDKKKSILKANLIAEQRYLKSKGLINESFHEKDGTPIGVNSKHEPISEYGGTAPYDEQPAPEPDTEHTIDWSYIKGNPINTLDDLDMVTVDFYDNQSNEYSYSLLELLYPSRKDYSSRDLTPEEQMVGQKLIDLISTGNVEKGSEFYKLVDDILGLYIDRNWSCCMEPVNEGQLSEDGEMGTDEPEKIPEIPEALNNAVMDFLSQQRVGSAAIANDNKAAFYEWLETMWSPQDLHYGANSNEIRSNIPNYMAKYLDKKGISGKRFVK